MKEAKEKQVKYASAVGMKKEPFSDTLRKVFPPEMVPTKKTNWIFGVIFILVVVIGVLSVPLGDLLAGKTDISIKIGIPWTFLQFDLENPENLPLKISSLILDLIIYIIIAYAIDVVINVFSSSFTPKKGKKSKHPRIYNIPQKSTTQQIAETAAQKTQQIIEQNN